MTSTIPENFVFNELDNDMTPTCELEGPDRVPCENTAKWIMHRSCCGLVSLSCDKCKHLRVTNAFGVTCEPCKKFFAYAPYAYTRIEHL